MESKYLTAGPVSSDIILKHIEKMNGKKDYGGHSIFLGQVRADTVNGKTVKAIEYSAYIELVNVASDKIRTALLSEYSDVKSIDILHSTGMVKAGEISLLVFVSAGHRLQAVQACSKAVELIKKNLPVWKKEIYEDNSHNWQQTDLIVLL